MIRGPLLVGLILLSNVLTNAAEEKRAESSPELRAFAQQLVKILETQDRQALADLIDWDYLLEHSVYSKFEFVSPEAKKEFEAGFLRASRDIEKPFYKKYLPETELVSLVRIVPLKDETVQIYLRYYTQELQRVAFRVARRGDKSLKIIDIGQGSPGSAISAAMDFSGLIAHRFQYVKTMGPLETLRDWLTQNNDLFADFSKASGADDYQEIIKLYPKLAKELQQMPTIEFQYYRANACVVKPVLKFEELQAFYDKAPDVAKLDLICCYALSQGDLKAALKTLDESDRLLAVDSLNNFQRAAYLADLKEFEQAYASANKLLQDFPNWKRSYSILMVVSVYDKNYPTTLKQLQLLRDQFELDLVELIDTDDDYKEFRKSPEYAVWKKENAAAAASDK